MAKKVTVTRTLKLDALGAWQQRLVQILSDAFPGARIAFAPLPNGLVGLFVTWDGFYGRGVIERQKMVRSKLEHVPDQVGRRITMIVTLTTEEAAGNEQAR